MSISAFPRLFFKGEMSFDPSLSNNPVLPDDRSAYDETNATLDPAGLASAFADGTPLDEIRKRLPELLGSSWNHYGTHRAVFETSMKVTGVSMSAGAVDAADALVLKQVQMKGKLVDLSANNDMGTQVFFDQVQFGNAAAGLRLAQQKRMTCRFLNFGRNVGPVPGEWSRAYLASGTWEVAFPKDGMRVQNAIGSPFLAALDALLDDPRVLGVAMRFRTYRTLYYQNGIRNTTAERPTTGKELIAHYANGKNFSNPAYSMVVGSLFPWTEGDHEGHPAGRMLFAPFDGTRFPAGTAFVEVDRAARRMTADLGDVVPETNVDLLKADLGTLSLIVKDEASAASPVPVFTLLQLQPNDYAQEACERTAGLFDADLSHLTQEQWDAVGRGTLVLADSLADSNPLHIVRMEQPLFVVVEDRDIYVDEGDPVTVKVKVMLRGQPAPAGTQILAGIYSLGSTELAVLETMTVDADARAQVTLQLPGPMVVAVQFRPFAAGAPQPGQILADPRRADFDGNFCALIRVLPSDDKLEADTADSQLTWGFIHNNVLAVWSVLNPVMARTNNPSISKPLHDRQAMEFQALNGNIKRAIAKGNFESDSYMPPTRDLSRGKRRLLERWCDLVVAGKAPPEPPRFEPLRATSRSIRLQQPDE